MKEDQRSLKRTLSEDKTKRSLDEFSSSSYGTRLLPLLLLNNIWARNYDIAFWANVFLCLTKKRLLWYYSKILNFTSFSSLSFFRKRRRYARRIYKKKKKSPRRRRVLRRRTVSSLRERESSSRFREGSTRPRRLAARRRYRRWLFSSVLLR